MDKLDLLLCASRILQLSENGDNSLSSNVKLPCAPFLSAGKESKSEMRLKKSLKKIEKNLGYRARRKKILQKRKLKCTTIVVDGNRFQRQCSACGNRETTKWRRGPLGPNSLCNSCGNMWEDRIMEVDLETGSVKSNLSSFKSFQMLVPMDSPVDDVSDKEDNIISTTKEPVNQ